MLTLAADMPWSDWQFYAVTLAFAWAAWMVVRPFVPRRKESGDSSCPNCAAGGSVNARPRRATLTVGGQKV